MFKPLLKPYFLIAITLYIIVRLGRLGWYAPNEWLNNYLNDFLCMPIILTICLVGVRFIKRIPKFHLTPIMIFGMTTFYAILFEYILPNSNPIYTADFVDVAMYFAGALFYWVYWRINRAKVASAIS
ncbi:MAG: hypothetical protein GQ574_13840 [Crocinitomix sp.]|nr:hypothetical protein [Crocinitomix sp.]